MKNMSSLSFCRTPKGGQRPPVKDKDYICSLFLLVEGEQLNHKAGLPRCTNRPVHCATLAELQVVLAVEGIQSWFVRFGRVRKRDGDRSVKW